MVHCHVGKFFVMVYFQRPTYPFVALIFIRVTFNEVSASVGSMTIYFCPSESAVIWCIECPFINPSNKFLENYRPR